MNTRVVLFFNRLFLFLLVIMFSFGFLFTSVNANIISGDFLSYGKNTSCALPSISDIFKNFFVSPFKNNNEDNFPDEYVYLGGFPVGLAMNTDGVIVIAKGTVNSSLGEINTTDGVDVKVGDTITKLDDYKVTSVNEIALFLATKYNGKGTVKLTIKRNEKLIETYITPQKDSVSGLYKLGLWVRDSASGVGTMTFIKENGEFSALGHPISDVDTASKIDVKNGNIYKCNIIGVQKGRTGEPGELKGLFLRNGASIGELYKNTEFGAQGIIYNDYINKLNLQKVKVGRKGSVRAGKATILTTIDGIIPEEFEIEIVKTAVQNEPHNKSMIIKITDKKLLSVTGGIVQGMSGSPILQDGKIVGAVTHVFVNDPTRGFGIYMDWML